jgi:hypothetical protein
MSAIITLASAIAAKRQSSAFDIMLQTSQPFTGKAIQLQRE